MNHWEEENSVFLAKWANNELTDQERSDFENSEEGKIFLNLVRATDNLELSPFDVDQAYKNFIPGSSKESKPSKRFFLRPVVRIAIAASIMAIIVFTYLLTRSDYVIISTAMGETQAVTLPGGSIVTLNANSEIKYEEASWSKERKVLLVGEAFFDVVKGNSFVVKTDEGNIKVLGTSFNIRARDDDLDVICYTGKVNVSNRKSSIDLTPGKAVRIANLNITRNWTKTLSDLPTWVTGITELDEATADIVLEELQNQFGLSIEYDGSLDSERFKLSFPNENMDEAIRLVMLAMDVSYTFDAKSKQLVIEGKN